MVHNPGHQPKPEGGLQALRVPNKTTIPFQLEQNLRERSCFADWGRLGLLVDSEISEYAPELEELVIQTALIGKKYPELFRAAVAWLASYPDTLKHDRFLDQLLTVHDQEHLSAIGLLLDRAQREVGEFVFESLISHLPPYEALSPYFNIQCHSLMACAVAHTQAENFADERWNIILPKFDAKKSLALLRDKQWIADMNPTLFK